MTVTEESSDRFASTEKVLPVSERSGLGPSHSGHVYRALFVEAPVRVLVGEALAFTPLGGCPIVTKPTAASLHRNAQRISPLK
jgi:hypothetical protein